VDGGLTNDPTLLQLQADALGMPLLVGRADTTALGAALLAGVGGGVFASVERAAELLGAERTVAPQTPERERLQARERWLRFAAAAGDL